MSSRHNLLFVILFALPLLANALESDREQPIHVRADWAEMDRVKGISLYRGDVVLDQGSLHIEADWVRVYHQNDELEYIEFEGRPVRFRQRPEGAAEDVEGEALQLDYYALEDRIQLRQDAWVQHDGDRFSGEQIDYDIMGNRVNASSEGKYSGRIHAIIQPRRDEKKRP